jgi:hypothetical protein
MKSHAVGGARGDCHPQVGGAAASCRRKPGGGGGGAGSKMCFGCRDAAVTATRASRLENLELGAWSLEKWKWV